MITGTGVHDRTDSVFRINWTGCSRSNGIRVHDRPDYAPRTIDHVNVDELEDYCEGLAPMANRMRFEAIDRTTGALVFWLDLSPNNVSSSGTMVTKAEYPGFWETLEGWLAANGLEEEPDSQIFWLREMSMRDDRGYEIKAIPPAKPACTTCSVQITMVGGRHVRCNQPRFCTNEGPTPETLCWEHAVGSVRRFGSKDIQPVSVRADLHQAAEAASLGSEMG